jgi:hypothetical protein
MPQPFITQPWILRVAPGTSIAKVYAQTGSTVTGIDSSKVLITGSLGCSWGSHCYRPGAGTFDVLPAQLVANTLNYSIDPTKHITHNYRTPEERSFNIEIGPPVAAPTGNKEPTVTDISINVAFGATRGGTLSGTDPDGDPLTYTISKQPSLGAVSLNPLTGAWTYTANSTAGGDSFEYTVSDGYVNSAPGKANIYVSEQGTSCSITIHQSDPNVLKGSLSTVSASLVRGDGTRTQRASDFTWSLPVTTCGSIAKPVGYYTSDVLMEFTAKSLVGPCKIEVRSPYCPGIVASYIFTVI